MKAGGNKVDYVGKTQKVFDGIVKNLKFLGADGQILTAGKSGKVPPGQVNGSGNVTEAFRYFYHPDHLGSTSYVTDASGEVYQHLEYFAFGETFVEEHSNTDKTPYLFNGKELDEETGLYYYGARYYSGRESIWLSVDPLSNRTPGWSPYCYVADNPVIMTDPDGRYAVSVHYRITYNALFKFGYSREVADAIAHNASVYADHPSKNVLRSDNATHGTSHGYRKGVDYSRTVESQDEKNSKWHSMMSDAEASAGMTHEQSMRRGLEFGWSNIFAQEKGQDTGKLGQGLHALQDAYAHEGASTNEHLGFNRSSAEMIYNDMYGNTSKAELITQSAVVVLGLFSGRTEGLSDGMRLDFSGMSRKQLGTVTGLLRKAGYDLNRTADKGFYSLKKVEQE